MRIPLKKTIAHPVFRLRDFPGFSRKNLQALENYYRTQLNGHQAPEKRVGWNSFHSQQVRFEALTAVGKLNGAKILDVGCGLGAFWGYLRKKKIKVDYTGVDLFPNVIAEAQKLYPDARFESRVLTAKPFKPGSFDYAFLSGVFNVKIRDNWQYMKALLSSLLRQTRKAVAFNVLNVEAGLQERDRFCAGPRELAVFGKKLGVSRVHLLDHYHHLDLTLFLYK
jgi:SAM-dependent methyltransferase